FTLAAGFLKIQAGFSSSQSSSTRVKEFYVDDVTVAKKYRAFFDDATLANSGASAVGGTVDVDATVNHAKEAGAPLSQSILHSGRTALADKAVFKKPLNNFDTTAGKPYTIEAWVKVNDASAVDSGKVVLAMMDNSDATLYTVSEEVTVDKNGWAKLSLDYVMPAVEGTVTAPTGICIMQTSGDVITALNIDDVSILPIGTKAIFDTDSEVSNDIVANGTTSIDKNFHHKASGRSLKVTGRTALDDVVALADPISQDEFAAKKSYTVTIQAMSPTAGKVVPYAEVNGTKIYGSEVTVGNHEWKELTFAFLATQNPTAIGVTQLSGDVLSTVYVDDIAVAETKYLDENYSFTTSCDEFGILSVSGKLKASMAEKPVSVKVLKAGYTIDDLATPAALLADGASVVNADGTYSVSVDCTNTIDVNSNLVVAVDGLNYTETTYLYDTIYYTNPLAVDRILDGINGAATGSALETVLTTGTVADDIGITTIDLPALSDYGFVYDYVVALDTTFATKEDFVAAYAKGWMVGCFNELTDAAVLAGLIADNDTALGLTAQTTYTEIFEKFENGEDTAVINTIILYPATNGVKFANEAALVKAICDETVMTLADQGVNYTAKMDAFIRNAGYLGVDFSGYVDGLDSFGKQYVGPKFVAAITSTTQFVNMQTLLDGYINEYRNSLLYTPVYGGGGGGSSSSGNKYGGVSIEVPSVPVTPNTGDAGAQGSSFADISDEHWAKESIEQLAAKGVISGYGDGSFKPENKVTRAEYVKMIISLFNLTDKHAKANFSDVSAGDWSYQYIATAEKLGIISGGGDGAFNPNGEITREDLVTISYRLFNALGLELSQINEKVYFVDRTEISAYAEEAAIALQRAGIVNGVATENADEFNFNPKHSASRAECAKILAGLLGYDW
ncbi:MAG: S-layer homology domain-containing protein, partial [Ruminococcaceae bacterium]|nr:S-layer homology domain-containing protein [Oscillospiraceae bacterium]